MLVAHEVAGTAAVWVCVETGRVRYGFLFSKCICDFARSVTTIPEGRNNDRGVLHASDVRQGGMRHAMRGEIDTWTYVCARCALAFRTRGTPGGGTLCG